MSSAGQSNCRSIDDAAGQAIANRMESNLRANDQVTKGINDGISLMQTAEGGLDGINDLLQRGRQLAVQAANDTLSGNDLDAIQKEFLQISEEVDRIAMETEIFGKHPLAPTEQRQPVTQLGNTQTIKNALQVPKGAWDSGRTSGTDPIGFIPTGTKGLTIEIDSIGADDDIQLFTRNGTHLVGTPLVEGNTSSTDATWQGRSITTEQELEDDLLNESNGFNDQVAYDSSLLYDDPAAYDATQGETRTVSGMTVTYTGDGDWYDANINNGTNEQLPVSGANTTTERVIIDEVNEPLFLAVVGSGSYNLKIDWDSMPDGPPEHPLGTPTDIVMSANYGGEVDKVTIAPTPADSQTLGLDNVNLTTSRGAGLALDIFDQAIGRIDGYRSEYGSLINRFDSAIANIGTQQIATSAAQSRIMDADYATEVSNMTREQILQQAGTSVLAQANQVPQGILSLLQ
ncbi:flagellin [Salinicola sp. LHM]|uniref:flagellin n=1 Tax=Salinicola sp. LHM TaxID=3065298 RepID=UPI002ACE073D|nr:flagellin [Salinicola sp. LHM]WQH34866.1 flagellin [Salinicola sp. LHM]